ncbi:hypothetical protein [Agromyces bauzanensis]|uniref:Uncharacterized protein n=1 Tax=Agromyces bauzanensis TaxID=1308924 RepID=A0A917UTT3_9MICO|nr:hypothetical protein [Agromyces bauzanensis]GGJ85006.1 hypothetical protein GCM10011372_24150 [Agromyces bauzanensis]
MTGIAAADGITTALECRELTKDYGGGNGLFDVDVRVAPDTPMLGWPDWLNRPSVFHASGNPGLGWPTLAQATVIITLAGPGLVLAFVLTARSRKVA